MNCLCISSFVDFVELGSSHKANKGVDFVELGSSHKANKGVDFVELGSSHTEALSSVRYVLPKAKQDEKVRTLRMTK